MRKWFYGCATIALTLILASCQEDPKQKFNESEAKAAADQKEDKDTAQNDSNENQDKNQSQNGQKDNTNENDLVSSSETAPPSKKITAPMLKNELSLGMPGKEVISLLGKPTQKVVGAKDGKPMWRYDLKTEEGYTYTAPNNRDDLDYESFINKDIQLIVFIGVENDKVNSYSIYYYDEEDVPKNYRKNEEYEKTDTMQ